MASNSKWTIDKAFVVMIFIIVAIPVWIICGPFYVIIKTIATIFQPYFYKKQSEEWNKYYQECLKEGIYVDYPPSYGTFCGVGPWFKKDLY
jgi:hypothetical protein